MAAFVGKMAAKKLLGGKKSKNQEAEEDPYHVKVKSKKMGVTYTKKEWKPLHPGLNPDEKAILEKVRDRAYSLDMCLFNVPLIGRFGYSSIIGLIPAVGDALDSLLAYMLIRKCCSVEPGLPHKIKNAMLMNLAFDFFIGLVPLLGDIADAIYKCNTKNFLLLEKELTRRAVQRQEDAGISNPVAGSSYGQHYVESEERYGTNTPSGQPPKYTSTKKPRRPDPAYDPRQAEGKGGYSGGRREVDLEAGGGILSQQPSRNQAFRS